jgi:PGF-CTERM protein
VLLASAAVGTASAFSNSGGVDWKYYKEITVKENSGEILTDYQVLMKLNAGNFPANAKSDGSDLRFEAVSGGELSYWIEEWNYPNNAKIWVKVPNIPANREANIKMYYGNPSASAVSDGDKVFEFFDDFEGNSLDTSKWFGTASVSNSEVSISGGNDILTLDTYGIGYAIRAKAKVTETSADNGAEVSFGDTVPFGDTDKDNCVYISHYNNPSYLNFDADSRVRVSSSTTSSQFTIARDSAYHIWNIKRASSSSNKYTLDNEDKEITTNIPAIDLAGALCTYSRGGGAIKIVSDWFLVRKYASTEPTFNFSQEYPTTAPTPTTTPTPIITLSNAGGGDWKYYKEITIKENSGEYLRNYQVLVELNSANFDFSKAKSDGSDIRFSADGEELNYWIEEWNAGAKKAKIWINVPSIPANGERKIKMYYGNPSASAVSDGDKVFEFFDDFGGSSLDMSKWIDAYAGGTYSVSSGMLNMHGIAGGDEIIACTDGWSAPIIMRYKSYTSRTDSHDTAIGFYYTNIGIAGAWRGAKGNAFTIYYKRNYAVVGDGINYAQRNLDISDAWHTFEMWRTGSVTEFYIDDIYQTTLDQDVIGIRYPRFFARNTHLKIDWILIRKYTSPEPTPIKFSPEYPTTAPTPTTTPTPSPTPISQEHIKFFVTPLGDNKYNITYTEYAPFTINVLRYSDGKGIAGVPIYQLTPKKFTEGTKEYLQQNIAGIISTRLAEEALKQALIKVGKASITKVFIVGVAVQVIDYSIYMKTPYIDLKSTTEEKGKAVLYLPAKEYTMTVDVTDMLYPKQEPIDQTAYPTPEQIAEQLARIYLNTMSKEYLQPIEYRDITLAIPTKLVLHEKGELTTEESKDFEDYCKIKAINSKVVGYLEELTFWVEPWVIPPTTIGTGKVEEEKMLKAHVLSPERHFFPHVVSLSHYFQNKGLACSYIELISHLQDWGALNWPLESRWPAAEDDFTVVIYFKEDKLKEYLTRKGMINQFSPKTVLQGEGWEVTKYTQTSADISGEHERFIFSIVVTDDEKREEAIKAFIENAYQLVGLPTEEENGIPGFEAVFAVLGLLVVAYVCGRRKK